MYPFHVGKIGAMELDTNSWISMHVRQFIFIPPPNEVGGGVYWIHLVRPSVRLSVDDMVSGA